MITNVRVSLENFHIFSRQFHFFVTLLLPVASLRKIIENVNSFILTSFELLFVILLCSFFHWFTVRPLHVKYIFHYFLYFLFNTHPNASALQLKLKQNPNTSTVEYMKCSHLFCFRFFCNELFFLFFLSLLAILVYSLDTIQTT